MNSISYKLPFGTVGYRTGWLVLLFKLSTHGNSEMTLAWLYPFIKNPRTNREVSTTWEMLTALVDSTHKYSVEIERRHQPFAWILPWAQMSLMPLSHPTVWVVWKVVFSFLLPNRHESARDFLASCISNHAWKLGTTCMIPWCSLAQPTYPGSAGDQQLPSLLKPRRHPSYERPSIPHHLSFIPKPYSLSGNFW